MELNHEKPETHRACTVSIMCKGGTKKRSIHIHKKYSLERWNKSKINGILPLDQTSQEPRKLREKQEKKQIKYIYYSTIMSFYHIRSR